jgi:uncharacterized membrane protein
MKWINPGSRYLLWSLNSLLLFLAFFSDKLEIPPFLQAAGRFHPVILHLPIGLLLITLLIYFLRKKFSSDPGEVISLLLNIGAVTSVISALFGIFLSKEGGYDPVLLGNHQWSGVAISILSAIMAGVYRPGIHSVFLSTIMLLMFPALVAGSHFGASITHGEDYLNIEKEVKRTPKVITDSSAIFEAVIEPILQTKCYSCHNEKKAKGQLIMTSLPKLLEGGKNGKIWVAGDPLNSHIIQRLNLTEEEKKHMPPSGKPQLSDNEIALLTQWIGNGANLKTRFVDLSSTDSFRIFAASFIPKNEVVKIYSFPAASPALLEKAQSPFLSLQPLSTGSPALRADFFIRDGFTPARISTLEKFSAQVVELNLGNMPVKDEYLVLISRFTNLEYLNLNGSLISGKTFNTLQQCRKLTVLSLAGTAVNKESLAFLAGMKNIKKVFCWNTRTTPTEISELEKQYKNVQWDYGYVSDTTEHLQLTPPMLVNMDKTVLGNLDAVVLKHPMPGVMIRYTTDGKDPDSNLSTVYIRSFTISKATRVKAIAVRPGWMTSTIADYTLFANGTSPSGSRLFMSPDKQYIANGIMTLTDGQKGDISNLKISWLGFRETHFDALFMFNRNTYIHEVVISAAKSIGAFVMPPQKIEVWGGKDSLNLTLVKTIIPQQPGKYEPDRIEAHRAEINGVYGCIRLKVYPVKKLPLWHAGKGEKAWIFLDEVFFN